MRYLALLVHIALFGLSLALPVAESSSKGIEPRSCTFGNWDTMYLLNEAGPDDYLPISNYLFRVAQEPGVNGGRATKRQYLLVHYPPTPYGSYGCELHWAVPEGTQFLNYSGSHQLDVKHATAAYLPPFRPTWNNVVPRLEGVLGTVNAVPGASAVVNTVACSNRPATGVGGGYGLAFVFKFADWVEQAGGAAALSFYSGYTGPAGVFKGPYLEYNC